MEFVVMVGVSHATAPLRVVEQLAVPADRLPGALDALRRAGCAEAVILSTCGRTEIYAVLARPDLVPALLEVLLEPFGHGESSGYGVMAPRFGPEAEAQLFRVTAGLESRIVGEVEIQGQVRSAARAAEYQQTMGPRLRALFAAAIATARRAHRETALGALGRSIGRSGVDAALRGLAVEDLQVAIVGTGRMAAVAFQRLKELRIVPSVYGRSVERAQRLTRGAAPAWPIDRLPAAMRSADLVILATSASGHLVTADEVRRVMSERMGRPLALLDLSVPRNVESCTSAIPGVQLIDLDGLGGDSPDPEQASLVLAVADAASIVAAGLCRLEASRRRRPAGPVITELQRDAEEACRRSLRQLRPELVADGSLDRVARTISRRLVHRSVLDIREAAQRNDLDAIAEIVSRSTRSDS